MKHRIEILVAILSASVMLLAGCDKTEVSDNTEVDSLRRSIIATINKKIDNVDGQIASLEDELASMRTSKKYKEDDLRLLEEKISAASKRLSDIRNSVALLENSSSSFTEKAEEINSDLESLDSEIASIQVMIQKLKADAADTGGGGVEKIIYVPKYDDRPDSLHYHLDGLKIIGDITLRFVTQPQESASSIAENWETSLSAHAIYDGDEFDLAITDVSVNSAGLLLISISADSLPRNFIEGVGCGGVKVMCGGEPICSSIRAGAIVDESAVFTMLQEFDCDGDGQIIDNLEERTHLLISEHPEINPYFNLLLAAMPALTSLEYSNNYLTILDLSNNPALTTLNCSHNCLTTLDLSNNPALVTLDCSHNWLTTLDLSSCSALTTLACSSNDSLATLDVSNNSALTSLDCRYIESLTTLDLSNCPALTTLLCGSWMTNTGLTTLDLSNNSALVTLDCSYTNLTTLDLSNNPALTTLTCSANYSLSTVDLSSCSALTTLYCRFLHSLTTLDLSNCPALTTLTCSNNCLTTLDLSNNPALVTLDCSFTRLTTLDVSNCPALTTLTCICNDSLSALDVSNCRALTALTCSSNYSLATLDVSNDTSLTSLDVSNLVKLTVSAGLTSSIYQIGQYVSIDGVTGIVYETSSPAIVSIDEISETWANGKTWCTSKGSAWSMPSLDELLLIYYNRATLNKTLSSIGATQFSSNYYWSSTANESYGNVGSIDFSSGRVVYGKSKYNPISVRAVRSL